MGQAFLKEMGDSLLLQNFKASLDDCLSKTQGIQYRLMLMGSEISPDEVGVPFQVLTGNINHLLV